MVAENYFYKPLARALRELIGDGAVGELLFVHVNALKTQRAEGWRSDPSLAGGGALFEGGIHWVDFLANLGPRVERVEGFLPGLNGNGCVDRSVLAVFRYSTGAVGSVAFYTGTAANHPPNAVFMKPTAFSGDAGQPEQRVGQFGFRFTF